MSSLSEVFLWTNRMILLPFRRGKAECLWKHRRVTAHFPQRRGIAIFVVTVIIAALTLGGMSILALMRVELETTRQRLRELNLANAARSASAMIAALSRVSPDQRDRTGGFYDNPSLFCNRVILPPSEGGDDTAFTILSPRLESESAGVRYGLVNESARLNLGTLLEWDHESPGTAKSALMKLPGMTSIMADSILDWLDSDESPRQDGAEASYYSARHFTYSPRNGIPVSLDELLLARGMTRYQLYGCDTLCNYSDKAGDRSLTEKAGAENGPIGSLRTTSANAAGMKGGVVGVSDTASVETEVTIPWTRLLTVFSAERDIDPTGRARIDLNEKDLTFLYEELTAALGGEIAAFVILAREYGVAASAKSSAGSSLPSRKELDFSRPGNFTFSTPFDLVGARVRVGSKEYLSPISADRQRSTELFQYLDYVSVGSSAVLTGRVNVNEAPQAVLELIPGLDSEMVARIVSSRPLLGRPIPKTKRHAAWLYTEGIVTLEQKKSLWGKLTTGGDVFRAQVVSFSELSGAFRRAEIVIDASVTPPRQVFFKDLTMFGRGFSFDVLKNRGGNGDFSENLTSKLNRMVNEQGTPATPFGNQEMMTPPESPFESVEGMTGSNY